MTLYHRSAQARCPYHYQARGFGTQGSAIAIDIALALTALAIAIGSFLIALPVGAALAFALALALAIWRPSAAPLTLLLAFLFQNTIIAGFTPLIMDERTFNAIRGCNFVFMVATFGAFLFARLLSPPPEAKALRRLEHFAIAVLAVMSVYFAIGALRGTPSDALIYLRNVMIPIACFYVGLYAAYRYRASLQHAVGAIAAATIAFGYCELLFGFDFLSLFNGDRYAEFQMRPQIWAGYWESLLAETGFVFTDLRDAKMVSFFNTPLLEGLFPKVFRLSGPNFHTISYAYALSIMASWLLMRDRYWIPILAVPLLLFVGSKGATILFIMILFAKIGCTLIVPRAVLSLFVVGTIAWLGAAIMIGRQTGDYHVLGLTAGLRDFLGNPLGQGLGIGGNLSSGTVEKLDWVRAQATGATDIPVESAVGVMLYQMGVGSLLFFAFLAAIVALCYRLYLNTRHPDMLFSIITLITISANAVLQEEAFFSPLALGFALLLVSTTLGAFYRSHPAQN